jgi:hypothetical protein
MRQVRLAAARAIGAMAIGVAGRVVPVGTAGAGVAALLVGAAPAAAAASRTCRINRFSSSCGLRG